MNPARQIAIKAGLPVDVPAQTINRACGSGMQSVITAAQALKVGDGRFYLCGGIESMSRVPYTLPQMRTGNKFGSVEVMDALISDGLTCSLSKCGMGITAENIAKRWSVGRECQDAYACDSQRRAATAQASGQFAEEIVPVKVQVKKDRISFEKDEFVRPDTTIEGLGKLRPAFQADGTVTAGNASGMNDGAAMLGVTTEEYAREHGLPVMARVISYATVGLEPEVMGMGPAKAIPAALKRAGMTMDDIDLFEVNEAFAVQAVAVARELGLDPAKTNVNGGAIALGHPIGASGARVQVTLIHALRRRNKELGVASLCIGGGMGVAMVVATA
jgi:acetyl-CoA C-acetyltransferase